MNMRFFVATLLLSISISVISTAQEKKELILGAHLRTDAGMSSSQTFDLVNNVLKKVAKNVTKKTNHTGGIPYRDYRQ